MARRIIALVAAAAALALATPAGAAPPTNPSCNGTSANDGQNAALVQSYLGLAGPGFSYTGPQGVATVVHEVSCPAGK